MGEYTYLLGDRGLISHRGDQDREDIEGKIDGLVKSRKYPFFVIPAKAGIQYFRAFAEYLDSGLRRNDDFLRDCQS